MRNSWQQSFEPSAIAADHGRVGFGIIVKRSRSCVNMAPAAPRGTSLGDVRDRALCGASSFALSMASAALALGIALSGQAHAQSSFNGTRTTTYRLVTGVQTSPFTFGTAAYINTTYPAMGVTGDTITNWNVINNGRIKSEAIGIYLGSPGGNSITNAGAITSTARTGA